MKRFFSWVVLTFMAISLCVGICAGCTPNNLGQNNTYDGTAKYTYGTEEGKNETILIHLDFGGGESNSSTLTAGRYGEKISGLPLNLTREGFVFSGWYTEPNCEGYQIADASGFIKNRNVLNESIYGVKEGYTESITLYAGWAQRKMQVTLYVGTKTYTVEVENGDYLGQVNVGGLTALTYSINPSGYPLYEKPITDDIQLYVVSYKSTCFGTTTSCEDNNGYNPKKSGSNDNVKMHKGWAMGNVELNVNKLSASETEYALNFHLLQDIYNVPKGEVTGNLKDCWVNNDSYSEKIYKTDLSGERVGFGAYYVEVIYNNGITEKFSDVNFLASSSQYDDIELCTFNAKANNPIKTINVSIVYELCFNNNLSYWLGCTWSANYRCDYLIKI